jgi:hypothetical protein
MGLVRLEWVWVRSICVLLQGCLWCSCIKVKVCVNKSSLCIVVGIRYMKYEGC